MHMSGPQEITQLAHSGVLIPAYEPHGFVIRYKGRRLSLTPEQEEMAMTWVKKLGTDYVKDPVFVRNFVEDFSKALGVDPSSKIDDFDFSEIQRWVEEEKAKKESMSHEEKKKLAETRKKIREANKEKYGYATLNGERVEIGNYMVEPSCIFMGRGCLAEDTLVKTDSNSKYIKEIKKGEKVAVHFGSNRMWYRKVKNVIPQGKQPVFEVRTRNKSILATENHPFLVLKMKQRKRHRRNDGTYDSTRFKPILVWRRLGDLKVGDYVVTVKRYNEGRNRTVNGTIITPSLSQVLGYFLGDGYIMKRSLVFCEGNKQIASRYAQLILDAFGVPPEIKSRAGNRHDFRIYVHAQEIVDLMRNLGFLNGASKKRVPRWIYKMTDDVKVAFIRGYLDADGTHSFNDVQGKLYGSYRFESPNRRLIEDLRELCVSANIQVSNIHQTKKKGFKEHIGYNFDINERNSILKIGSEKISKKFEEYKTSLPQKNYCYHVSRLSGRYDWSRLHILRSNLFTLERVLSIRPDSEKPVYDLEIADEAHPNFIANGFVVHNSHPLRGRWKQGATYEDVILNLSPDAPTPELPEGRHWGGRVFDPEALWVAKWRDKLSGDMKYVWIADTARFKQEREIIKFNEALELEQLVGKVRRHIERNLTSEDITRRKVATVAYLIDALKLRVGDEKDKDEADTVGAVTLRGSHIKIGDSGDVKFDFLGKDSVRWVKTAKLPPQVVDNLRSFIGKPREPVFSGVRSEMVNAFLGEVTPWLTAKVFRTYHASKVVRDYLAKSKVEPGDQDFKKKYVATMANLEAAITCNHKRKLPKNWAESLSKKEERLRALKAKLREVRKKPPSKMRAKRVESLLKRIEAAEVKVKIAKATRDYNLGTSLKSYIDPRIYAKWAKELGYDWKEIYPKTLQRKFAWVDDSSAYK